jgi:hypothetical protein
MNYRFVGWCQNGKHDKVWGSIGISNHSQENVYMTFWGRRGGKLKTKVSGWGEWEMEKMIASKTNQGYRRVNPEELASVYEDFEADLKKTAVWAILKAPHG